MRQLLVVAILLCSAFVSATVWPGQNGNAVGHTAWSGWTGSFNATACSAPGSGTSWANATITQNCTFSTASHTTISCNFCEFIGVDFKSTATADNNILLSGSNVMLVGCRFQSNYLQGANVSVTGGAVWFFYDSFVPLASFATSPPGSVWPSAGAGANSTTITSGTNALNGNDGYEIGILANNSSGPITADHCDFWGFGDAIQIETTTAQMTFTNNWIHDIPDPTPQVYHTDGIGYLNGATGPNNVLIVGNTIATLGNTNLIAFQAQTGGASFYNNINVNDNFLSGDNASVAWCRSGGCVNSTFYGNVYGTDIKPGGAVDVGAAIGTGSVWACNTIEFLAGTTWTDGDGWTPTSGMNGQYFKDASLPNSATDQGSNTLCGIPSPSSLQFGNQQTNTTSAGQTITFSSTNTGTLSSISVALNTGTQFSVSSNTCGTTLASGNSCSITVKFTPTGLGPQTDTLKITDNSTGVSSPQLVPLAGIGATSGGTTDALPPASWIFADIPFIAPATPFVAERAVKTSPLPTGNN